MKYTPHYCSSSVYQHKSLIKFSLKQVKIWPLYAKAGSLEETLMLGKTEVKRKMGQQRMRMLDSIMNSMDINLSSLVTQMVKKLPAMQETWVRSLGWEDPLEEGMATHSSILNWRISMNRGAGALQCTLSQRTGHNLATAQQRQSI